MNFGEQNEYSCSLRTLARLPGHSNRLGLLLSCECTSLSFTHVDLLRRILARKSGVHKIGARSQSICSIQRDWTWISSHQMVPSPTTLCGLGSPSEAIRLKAANRNWLRTRHPRSEALNSIGDLSSPPCPRISIPALNYQSTAVPHDSQQRFQCCILGTIAGPWLSVGASHAVRQLVFDNCEAYIPEACECGAGYPVWSRSAYTGRAASFRRAESRIGHVP